jgi:hypothetical protein
MSVDTSGLTAAVAAAKPGSASIIALLSGFAQRLKDALAGDPAAQAVIDSVTTDVTAEAAAISAAVAANPLP